MIKQTATYGVWTVNRHDDNKIEVLKNGMLCEKAKPALREIAAEIGFEINPDWTSQQLGANVLKAMLEAGEPEPVSSPIKDESKPAHEDNSPETKVELNTISFDNLLASLAKHEEDEGITLYQLCKTDTTACMLFCDQDAMEGVSFPLEKTLPDFLNKIKKLADKGNLNAIQFWARTMWQESVMDDDELMDILISKKWLRYVEDEVLENMAEHYWEDEKITIALQRELAHRDSDGIETIKYAKLLRESKWNPISLGLSYSDSIFKEWYWVGLCAIGFSRLNLKGEHKDGELYEWAKEAFMAMDNYYNQPRSKLKDLENKYEELESEYEELKNSPSASYSSSSSGSSRSSANEMVSVEIKYKSHIRGSSIGFPKTKVVTMTNAEYKSLRDGSMKARIAYVTNNCGVVSLVETVTDVTVSLI